MRNRIISCLAGAVACLALSGAIPGALPGALAADAVTLRGGDDTVYSASASLLPGTSLLVTSGSVPRVQDESAAAGTPARYGDTYTQALSVLDRHAETLAARGLTPEDVIYARAYVVGDPAQDGAFDWAGWNRAFEDFFGRHRGPSEPVHKPTRTSIGITRLGNPDWLIEIELIAAYPDGAGPWLGDDAGELRSFNPNLAMFGSPDARIATAAAPSPDAPLYFTSGVLADTKDPDAPADARERRGDMEWQGTSALEKLEANLASVGLTMRDVYFLRAMIFPDPLADGEVDFAGWNRAFGKFFGTPANPHKPTRTTMAAPGFNAFNALIEIEVYAAFPDARGAHTTYDADAANPNLLANGDPDSFLSAGMAVARHTGLTMLSGSIADAEVRSDPAADMKAHALSALETMAARLDAAGLGFEDVIQLRAYLNVGDDFGGNFGLWNEAYGQYFDNEDNPHKPVRTALPVVGLPGDSLIEIEAIVASPE